MRFFQKIHSAQNTPPPTAPPPAPAPNPFDVAPQNLALRALRTFAKPRNLARLALAALAIVVAFLVVPRAGTAWTVLGPVGQFVVATLFVLAVTGFAAAWLRTRRAHRAEEAVKDRARATRRKGSIEMIGFGQVWDTIVAPLRGPACDVRRVRDSSIHVLGKPGEMMADASVTTRHPFTIVVALMYGRAWSAAVGILGREEIPRVRRALELLRDVRVREFGNHVTARHILVGVGSGTTAIRSFYLNAETLGETGDATFVWITHPNAPLAAAAPAPAPQPAAQETSPSN